MVLTNRAQPGYIQPSYSVNQTIPCWPTADGTYWNQATLQQIVKLIVLTLTISDVRYVDPIPDLLVFKDVLVVSMSMMHVVVTGPRK